MTHTPPPEGTGARESASQEPDAARQAETAQSPAGSRQEPAAHSCAGFPDRCPNLRDVEPSPPSHYGGIRCGCHDNEPAPEPDARRERYAAALLGPDASGTLDSAADDLVTAVMAVADEELKAQAFKTARMLGDKAREMSGSNELAAENARLRAEIIKLRREVASAERIRENADLHLGQEMARRQLAEKETARLTAERDAMAPMFAGLERLLTTSSRDWGQYRVDAWLYAVLVGWECEEGHEPCDDAAMREVAQLHGWDDATVAKARRYRDAVRRVQAGDSAQPERNQPGLRGLLEHVGIDTTGRDITVDSRTVDTAEHGQPDPATEAADCPGYETDPSVCRCPCEGCRHNCAAHQTTSDRSQP